MGTGKERCVTDLPHTTLPTKSLVIFNFRVNGIDLQYSIHLNKELHFPSHRSKTKFQEGNVYGNVLSVEGGGSPVSTTYNSFKLSVQEITPGPALPDVALYCAGTPYPTTWNLTVGNPPPGPLLVASGGQDCRHLDILT